MKNLIFIILLFYSGFIFAQTSDKITVSGVVTDYDKETLPGVTVYLVNENNRMVTGTITDINGKYNIQAPTEGRLQFSFVGMRTLTINIDNRSSIDVSLAEQTESLDEVKVVATMVTKSNDGFMPLAQRDLASANEVFKMENMEDVQVNSIDEALAGRLANVNITFDSGDPGSGSAIRIRGTASLNGNNEPLIVVDGIPFETSIDNEFDFATANEEDFGSLVNIAPEDIMSIEVLKDAAATAIWGERGSNGVLVITSKRGSVGKTTINFSTKLSTKYEPDAIPMLNGAQYYALQQDEIYNAVKDLPTWSDMHTVTDRYNEIQSFISPNFKYYDEYNQNTNWLDEVSKTAFTQNYNLSMSGGGDRARYYISAGYLGDKGTTEGTSLERFNSRINIDYNVSKKLLFSTDFSFSRSVKDAPYYDNVRSLAMRKNPGMSPWDIDEYGNITNEYFTADNESQNYQGRLTDYYNPVAAVNESFTEIYDSRIRSTFRIKYDFHKNWTYQNDIAFDLNNTQTKKFLPQVVTGISWNNESSNRAYDGTSESFAVYVYQKLNYHKTFNAKHQLNGLLANTIRTRTTDAYSGRIFGLPSNEINDASAGGKIIESNGLTSGTGESREYSILGKLHYKFDDKYIIDLGLRSSGNSAVGKDMRYGVWPSVALAWRLSNENWLKKEWLSDAKLRASWGRNGNLPRGGAYSTYSASGSYIDMPKVYPDDVQLDKLSFEIVEQVNLGFDLSAVNYRYELSFNYYDKKTSDMIFNDVALPSSTGFGKIRHLNMGGARNYGWELTGRAELYKNQDWSFQMSFNVAQNFNEITSYPSNFSTNEFTLENGDKSYARTLRIGDPIGAFYGFIYEGVYQSEEETYARDANGEIIQGLDSQPVRMQTANYEYKAGDARYKDINFDGRIDEYDVVYLGNGMPEIMGGLGPYIKYKNLSLNAFFSFNLGQEIVNLGRMYTENMYGRDNQSTAVLHRWRKPGDNTHMPRALYNSGYNYLGSDRFVEKGSYMRLKTLTINYRFQDRPWMKACGLTKMNVFLSGYDLLTWTNYKGQDPEVSVGGGWKDLIGADRSRTPRPQRFTFGVNAKF